MRRGVTGRMIACAVDAGARRPDARSCSDSAGGHGKTRRNLLAAWALMRSLPLA